MRIDTAFDFNGIPAFAVHGALSDHHRLIGSSGPSLLCITCMAKRDHQKRQRWSSRVIEDRDLTKLKNHLVGGAKKIRLYPEDLTSPWQSPLKFRKRPISYVGVRHACATEARIQLSFCASVLII